MRSKGLAVKQNSNNRLSILARLQRAKAYLRKVDGAVSGQGGSSKTFSLACTLLRSASDDETGAAFDLPIQDALRLLLEWNKQCRPPWSQSELIHKLNGAAARLHRDSLEDGDRHSLAATKTVFDPDYLAQIASLVSAPILPLLDQKSAQPPKSVNSHMFLRLLYAPNEKVLIFTRQESQGQCVWSHESDAACIPQSGPDGVWYLAQPVDGTWHPNPRECLKLSRRSEESVTAWRYFVVESDEADRDQWLRALVQLELRIAAIYTSGKRSIHALCRADRESKHTLDARIEEIKPELVRLGADPKCLTAVRLTRLPGCWRGSAKQELLYVNPNPTTTPIIKL
jgi:hypothetical protein